MCSYFGDTTLVQDVSLRSSPHYENNRIKGLTFGAGDNMNRSLCKKSHQKERKRQMRPSARVAASRLKLRPLSASIVVWLL